MAEVKDLLGLALRGVEPRHDDLEAVLRLAGRYRRGRRLVAGEEHQGPHDRPVFGSEEVLEGDAQLGGGPAGYRARSNAFHSSITFETRQTFGHATDNLRNRLLATSPG